MASTKLSSKAGSVEERSHTSTEVTLLADIKQHNMAENDIEGLAEPPLSHSEIADVMTFYQLFLQKINLMTLDMPLSLDQIIECLQLQKSQVIIWLKKAELEGIIQKINRPVRYQWISEKNRVQQFSLPME